MIIERGRFMLQLVEEWSQFFQSCNWRTFHFCQIEAEDESWIGNVEVTVIILGIGFRLVWNHTETPERRRMLRDIVSFNEALSEEEK